ncbi:unnamed protein product [Owenia fusiformis]|uniref:Uncharacterized protein n=1 Tax=Owenia fusiformis TaxID=6347 RepID=A0A8J1U1M4_OWEFU|nr:unnamed protein product [Owenia fusiformis]
MGEADTVSSLHSKHEKHLRELICGTAARETYFLHTICAYGVLDRDALQDIDNQLPESDIEYLLEHYEQQGGSVFQFITWCYIQGYFDSYESQSHMSGIDTKLSNKNARKCSQFAYTEHDSALNGDINSIKSNNNIMEYVYIDINAQDSYGLTALEYAMIYERWDLVKLLFQIPQFNPNTLLHFTITGLDPSAGILFQTRPLVDMVMERAISAHSTEKKEQLLNGLVWRHRIDLLISLLKQPNLDVNSLDCDGESALYSASKQNQQDIVKLLLEHSRIDVNQHCIDGRTALHVAIFNNCHSAAELLLTHSNIDVNVCDSQGTSPLMLCANKPQLLESLLMLCDDINVNAVDSINGFTVLHRAVLERNDESCRILCGDPRVNPLVRDKYSHTPLGILEHKSWTTQCSEIMVILLNKEQEYRAAKPLSVIQAIKQLGYAIDQSEHTPSKKAWLKEDLVILQLKLSKLSADQPNTLEGLLMPVIQRKCLVKHYDLLCDKLIPKNYMSCLRAKGVLTESQLEAIQGKPTCREQSEELLKCLPRCGNNAFDVFCDVLIISNQASIADMLRSWVKEKTSEDNLKEKL